MSCVAFNLVKLITCMWFSSYFWRTYKTKAKFSIHLWPLVLIKISSTMLLYLKLLKGLKGLQNGKSFIILCTKVWNIELYLCANIHKISGPIIHAIRTHMHAWAHISFKNKLKFIAVYKVAGCFKISGKTQFSYGACVKNKSI